MASQQHAPHHPQQQHQSTTSPSQLPSWHFPFGPSTRYTQREGAKSIHARMNSIYTPTAPKLSTAARAHRRARSTASDVFAPSSIDRNATRKSLSRHSSSTNTTSAQSSTPVTPAKSPRPNRFFDDSPFSDYFTDDSVRSSGNDEASSSELQHLLVRILKLQSYLMRQETQSDQAALNIINFKLSEIEYALANPHGDPFAKVPEEPSDNEAISLHDDTPLAKQSSFSAPPLMSDNEITTSPLPSSPIFSASNDHHIPTSPLNSPEPPSTHAELSTLLSNLTNLQTELRIRHSEMRALATSHSATLAERDERIEQLRTENELLRSDLGFEYSELLFLKLQMKGLEVKMGELTGEADEGHTRDETREEKVTSTDAEVRKRRAIEAFDARRNHILGEMDTWRVDWDDVHTRFRRRRSGYGALSPDFGVRAGTEDHDVIDDRRNDDKDWRLETVSEVKGRVTSLTIKRVLRNGEQVIEEAEPQMKDGSTQTAEPDVLEFDIPAATSDNESVIVCAEDVEASPELIFIDQATQTDHQYEDRDQGKSFSQDGQDESLPDLDDEDDCAITTSSETEYSDDEDDFDEGEDDTATPTLTPHVEKRTAWEELCDSLANLAGMGDDHFS